MGFLDCGRQISATAETVMHRSKLPSRAWFWPAQLTSTHSIGVSTRQSEDQFGITYKTVWLPTQTLCRSLVNPNRDPLEGVVGTDRGENPVPVGDTFFKPGNAGGILIVGAVEAIYCKANADIPRLKLAEYFGARSGGLGMQDILDNLSELIEMIVEKNVSPVGYYF